MRRPKSSDALMQELQQQSEDAALWEQAPADIEARPSRTSVLSLRLPTAEFHALLHAARNAGESVSEYVRKAIAMRQSSRPMAVSYTLTIGYPDRPNNGLSEWRTYTAGNLQNDPTLVEPSRIPSASNTTHS